MMRNFAAGLCCALGALAALPACNAPMTSPPATNAAGARADLRQEACSLARRAAHRSHIATATTYPTNKSLLFDADFYNDDVQIYQTKKLKSNPQPIATFSTETGYPFAVAMDSHGTLYVADGCNGSDVEEFAKGQTSNPAIITDGISDPSGLAIDASNTLYVSNYPAAITVYAYGESTPEETITGDGLIDPEGLAVDKGGNLYIADIGADQVFELPKGSGSLMALNLQDLEEPIGVAVDQAHGYLWVTDGKLAQVNVYQLGSTSPSEEITGFEYPFAVAIQNIGKPKQTAVVSDIDAHAIYAYKPLKYSPYAALTVGINGPVGLLISKP
jgi:DNA-binding beta-propeller fold protein YncE